MLTWVEVSKSAIKYNLAQFKRLVGRGVLLMPVIKSNAYGHGLIEVAKICEDDKNVDKICVVSLDEALTLLKNGIKKPLLILSFYELDRNKIKIALKNNVIFPVYRLDQINYLNKIALSLKRTAKVHLKIDTGTTRIGILPDEATKFAKKITALKNLKLDGIWSHFASSESDQKFTKKQLSIFNNVIKKIEEEGIVIPTKHFACSAAAILHPQSQFNAVRLGLSTYGLYPDKKSRKNINLKPALSLNTKIIQLKTVKTDTKIGYGGSYTTKSKTTIAVLPIGYWDGLDRKLSNIGEVLINGKKFQIRGRICMNLTMVEIGNTGAKVGDKVTIIGRQGTQEITADDVDAKIDTINYEVIDRINPLIDRIVK